MQGVKLRLARSISVHVQSPNRGLLCNPTLELEMKLKLARANLPPHIIIVPFKNIQTLIS